MNPHFFFVGKLSREEASSAFLASLLEQRADFRTFLFKLLGMAEPEGPLEVNIEKEDVDIRIDYPAAKTVLLIENKLRPGSLQVNQLVRYYQHTLANNSALKIVSILLAPNEGGGAAEVTRLTKHEQFRPTDGVYKISWGALAEFPDILPKNDSDMEFVRRGFECIGSIIVNAIQEKYPLVGGREIANDIARAVLQNMEKKFPGTRLGFWRGRDFFNIYSIGTDITIYIDLAFRIENKAPYAPLQIPDRQHVNATLRTKFTLSAKGKRNPTRRETWDRICRNKSWASQLCDVHELTGRWFKHEIERTGDCTAIAQELTAMGCAVIRSWAELL